MKSPAGFGTASQGLLANKGLTKLKISLINESLLDGLNIVTSVLSTRTTMDILEGVLLRAEVGGVRLFATNLEMSVDTGLITAEVEEEGHVVLDGRTLHDIARKLPNEAGLSISLEAGFVVTIESGRSKFNLVGMDPIQYPTLPNMEEEGVFELPLNTFKWLLRQTLYAAAQQDTGRPILTGALLEQAQDGCNQLRIVALDGVRMAYTASNVGEVGEDNLKVVIPKQALNEVLRISGLFGKDEEEGGTIRLISGKHHCVFEIGSVQIMTRVLEGDFIDYQKIFGAEQNIIARLNRTDLLSALERVSLISAKDTKKGPIRLVINDEYTMSLHASSAIGRAHEVVNIEELELSGQAESSLEIGFNPVFLIGALKTLGSDEVVMSFNSPLSPSIIRPARSSETEESISMHLVLPVRIEA